MYNECRIPSRNRSAVQVALPMVMGALALLTCSLRLASRTPFSSGALTEDIVFGIAVMATISVDAIDVVAAAKLGLGADIWTIEPSNIDGVLKCFYIAEPLYVVATDTTKIAVLIFYLQIFPHPKFRVLCHCIQGMCFAHVSAFGLSSLLQCSPVHYSWQYWRGEKNGHCVNTNIAAWAAAATNITLDVIVLVMPLPLLARLLMPVPQKVRALLLFSVGFL
ncbi:hypothetical protein BDV33DRAFT_210880 [Aspergillus novoparasiticus]|uniref:Rhodopsin domain-containing protein n=1 Tax=Aspergillus novoparasiticus TaxID=986946 RepID=A0A5N6E5D8_9EURO|nr:hypothetical protein BDV33DRAFT_210880 [Aspergillus novoparasiticus]